MSSVAEALKTMIAAQSFASGVTVTSPRNPASTLEGLSGTRMECVGADFERRRFTRKTDEENVSVDVHVEKVLPLADIDSEVDAMLTLSYSLVDYLMEAVPAGWNQAPGESQEPLYSLDDIRQTGEFRSVVRATYQRVIDR